MAIDFQPAPPRAAYFDAPQSAWMLSRFADVHAALRTPALRQVSSDGAFVLSDDTARHAQLYAEIQADMARLSSAEWRAQIESAASGAVCQAATGRPVEIVRDIIHPWSAAMLLDSSGLAPAQAGRLTKVATRLFSRSDQGNAPAVARVPSLSVSQRWHSWRRRQAQAEMDRIWKTQKPALSKSMLTGLTQTLPHFLANAWLALLQHPKQAAQLLARPDLMPGAVEELLRYAGIVHSLYRRATAEVEIGGVVIAEDQRVTLRLASANFDPEKFPNPRQLDLTRPRLGNLGLGTGGHNCVGAALVRMAVAAATPVFLASQPVLEAAQPIVWTEDPTLRWPREVWARLSPPSP